MKYDYDIITIGLGPAGMAVSIMGSEMGLKVCAIEKNRIGGECMNVGCIPSKAILRIAKTRNMFKKLPLMELSATEPPDVLEPFVKIGGHIDFIRDKKTMKMFEKVDLFLNQGSAEFVDSHTVAVGERKVTARRIFICAGTRPKIPSFSGLNPSDCLTNENLFTLEKIPSSLLVIGGGATACEMAQAFSRLGSKVTIVIRGSRLLRYEDPEAAEVVERALQADGIEIMRERKPARFERRNSINVMTTDKGEEVVAEKVLIAAGRRMNFEPMKLENAGVKYSDDGIKVNKHLQTSVPHIYSCGDCNGFAQFSHSAMHQGMIALMNSMTKWPVKFNFKKYVIPWTMFTEPQFSQVGMTEDELKRKKIKYEVITARYEDYGAAIAENVTDGFVKVFTNITGRIYGVVIVGEGSGEMINEWALAIHKKIRMHDIMMLQHSFPTMGFLSKRAAEMWMMNRMQSDKMKGLCRLMFRI